MALQNLINITQQSTRQFAIGNSLIPQEGPLAVCAVLNFGLSVAFLMDGESLFGSANPVSTFSQLQTIYVDNQGSDNGISIAVGGSGQFIQVKGRTQGYYQVIAPNLLNLIITCTDVNNTTAQIILLNYVVPPFQWATK